MTRLTDLRNRLARLRRRRQRVRWETAYSALLLAVLWVLAVAFLVDWSCEMLRVIGLFTSGLSLLPRLLLLAAYCGLVVWAFRRFTLPWLGKKETDLDMALLVERQEHIDSDLIAAVQFESPEAPEWGSVQLEQAVIERVAISGRGIDVMRGVPRRELSRRAILLAITVVLWAATSLLFSDHVGTFLNRLVLGSRHYPTHTIIESITIAGREVDSLNPARTPLRLQFGQAVTFEVKCSGELPERGEVELTASASGLHTTLELEPVAGQEGVYSAELPRLVDSVRYQLFLGDAWTDPGRLSVGQLPVVEVELEVESPPYARRDPQAAPLTMPRGLREVSVIEGSRVRVKVYSDNKPLKDAVLSIDEKAYALRGVGDGGSDPAKPAYRRWILDSEESPLSAVTKPIRYSIQVTDEDGLQLEKPIDGVIRIQADSAPRIASGVVTEYVLPVAKPTVYFQAVDDYGLARISINRKVFRADGEIEESQSDILTLAAGDTPQTNLEQSYPFDLSSLDLSKGDRLEITLRAVDFRGPRKGKAGLAEPLVFHVTDEAGIFEHMMEADRQSARQLKTMIQRQLGIGESP